MLHAACRALSGLRNVYQALQLRDPETHSGISRDSLKQARLQNPIKDDKLAVYLLAVYLQAVVR